MSDPQPQNGNQLSQSGMPMPTIADAAFDRAHVPLNHLIIRLDDDPAKRSVITEGEVARIVATELSDFVEIIAVSEGKHVSLVGFSLFNELRMISPEERPTKPFTITKPIAPGRALAITIRPIIGPNNEPCYHLDVIPDKLSAIRPKFALNWRSRELVLTLILITGLFVGLVVALVVSLLRPDSRQARTQSGSPERSRSPGSSSVSVATPTSSAAPSPIVPERGTPETIVDGNLKLQIQSSGAIQGLENLSPDIASEVRSALSNPANLSIDATYRPPSRGFTLMGPPGSDEASLTSPVGVVLREPRPSFKWTGPTATDSYEVVVRDLSTDEVAASTAEPIRTTNWMPNEPLKRGHSYGWIVNAILEGNRVRIPSSGMGMFKILDESGVNKLQKVEAQFPRSRLVRGITLYRLGLVDEAQREFEQLKDANPDSQLVRTLIQRVKQTRGR